MDWMPTGRRAALERLASIQRLEAIASVESGLSHWHPVIPFEERRVHSMFAGPTISQVFKRDWEPVPAPPPAGAAGWSGRQFGRLRRVDAGEVWSDPDREILAWLVQPESVRRIARALSLPLVVPSRSEPPGASTVLLEDEAGRSILVGCWHGPSTHGQLAGLLARAAGEAVSGIIWISGRFRPEQRKALAWLDSVTDSNTRFYGIELQLWAIDDSNLIPRLRVV
jgi:hypothetical protein